MKRWGIVGLVTGLVGLAIVSPGYVRATMAKDSTFGRPDPELILSSQNRFAATEYVPDARTAIRIAEAVCIPVYGEALVKRERPFRARREGLRWVVEGSLPRGLVGGTAVVVLVAKDGRIISVMHGK